MAGKKVLSGGGGNADHKTSLLGREKVAQPAKLQGKGFFPIPAGTGVQSSKCTTCMFTDMKYYHERLEVALYSQRLSTDAVTLKL